MYYTLKLIALAMLVATTRFAGMAYAQAPNVPATVVSPALAASKASILTKSPEFWITYDHTTYSPVVDNVSRHLDAARKAFDAKDNKQAALEMHAVADELKQQADQADYEYKVLDIKASKRGRDAIKRLKASALKVSAAATAIEDGKIETKSDLDKVIDKATRVDMDQRWLVVDVATWYPVSEEPQHQFTDAVTAYAQKDYKTAAIDIRKANSYLAQGHPRQRECQTGTRQLNCPARHARRRGRKRLDEGRTVDG